MLNAERFKEEINKHNNEFGLTDSIADCKTLECLDLASLITTLEDSKEEYVEIDVNDGRWVEF